MKKLHTHQLKVLYLLPFKHLCAATLFLLFSSHLFAADILMGQYEFTTGANQLKASSVTQGITMGDIQVLNGSGTTITVNYANDVVETSNWGATMNIGAGKCINLSITKGSNATEFNVNKIIVTLKRTTANKIQINFGNEINTFDYRTYAAATTHGTTSFSAITLTENINTGNIGTTVTAIPAVTDANTLYLSIGTMSASTSEVVYFDKIEVWGTVTTTPATPTITSITPTDTQLSVAFTAGSDGNSAITNYEYSTDGGSSWTTRSPAASTSPLVISGLTNSTAYNVQLRALNTVGTGTATTTTVGTTYLFYEDFAGYDAANSNTTLATLITMSNDVSLSRVAGWTGSNLYQYRAGSPNLGTVCLGSTASDSAYITTPAMDLSQPFTLTFKARSLSNGTDGRFYVYLDGTQLIYSGTDSDNALTDYTTPAFVGTATSKLTFTGRKVVGNEIVIDRIVVNKTTCSSCDLTLTKDAALTISENKTYTNLSLAPGAKLTLGAGTLTVTNGLTLQSDANGTATILDSYSTPTLTATVQQHVSAGRNWYLSSPISAADYSWLSRGTSVQGWDEATKAWVEITTGTLVRGKGYVQVATSTPTVTGTSGTVNVTGTTNSGDVAITVSRTESGSSRGFNLVGNPYPSYLKWSGANGFLADASNDSISTSFWYRTKNSSDAYVFTTYNGSSHLVVGGSSVNSVLNEYIPPMQAFWIRVDANATTTTHNVNLTFKNNMRFHGVGDNNKFKAPKADERQLVRLQLANGTQSDEALIYFDAAAANSFDKYDSPKMMNNSTTLPDLYTTAGTEKLAINGLNELADNMEFPLGFSLKAAVDGLKIKVSELNNFASEIKVYLLDKEQNTQTELLPTTEYTFNTTASTTNNESRFSLLFKAPGITTDAANVEKEQISVFVNAANQITIIAPEKSIYTIYNAVGQLIENGTLKSGLQTTNRKLQTGIYVLKVNNQSTRVIIK